MTLESLSTGIFEPRTAAGNGTFSSAALIASFLFINSSCKCYNESYPTYFWSLKFAKTLNIRLPVAIRGSNDPHTTPQACQLLSTSCLNKGNLLTYLLTQKRQCLSSLLVNHLRFKNRV